ncbi:MAG: hypothetical protein KGZ65_07045 [Sphingomonadales bacterium]|nr:hypothetical protein [Sphingomonadales bacterium]
MIRARFLTRTALGLVVALGLAAGTAAPSLAKEKPAKEAKAADLKPSKAYIPAYTAAKSALDAAAKRADVVAARQKLVNAQNAYNAATGKKGRADAQVQIDAATTELTGLLTAEKGLVEAAIAAATVPDDKDLSGGLLLTLGNLSADKATQRRGVQMRIDSGRVSAADLPKFNGILGSLSMDLKDYPAARTALKAALDGGSTDTDVSIMYADAHIKDGQQAAGLKILQDVSQRAGATVPVGWLRYGLQIAYNAKLADDASWFANKLTAYYPTTENWSLSLAVVRDLRSYAGQDQIDLLRLMERTKSFLEERDYVDYIQAADPRRLPGEALKIINQGLAAGKLNPADQFVTDAKAQATSRIGPDKASLAALQKDARAAGATAATAAAAGDAYLSYDDAATAEAMYAIALGKPGVDTTRVQLRMGIAQADQGKWADAEANFAKVTDARAPIAQLWTSYVKNKAAGK